MAFWLPLGTDYGGACGRRPDVRRAAKFEAATGYVPKRFSEPCLLQMETGQLHRAQRIGEQSLPVILATLDGQHAMRV
jgi:hypothetical protein